MNPMSSGSNERLMKALIIHLPRKEEGEEKTTLHFP